ncbi:MAG: carboxypeptidase-like regulatory domain-containing protein [Bacteroidetes bacterium]|nr:carboxypeptidase-like regulatory domain-containing protein [Bacteroidota bacterium]
MKRLIFILLVFCNTLSFAGNKEKEKVGYKTLTGKVYNQQGEEIPAVKITIKETNESFYTDLSGTFKLAIKRDKSYSILIESIGYMPLETKSNTLSLFSEILLKPL